MFMPQIKPKYLADVDVVEAAKWIVTGLFFKLYVANNLNTMTAYLDYPLYQTLNPPDRWTLLVLYSFQIYADFFGYSSIALGLGLLFGYRLPVNFNLPYISRSFSEFWTRWHMSLSNWLRTYLYIPLGGNRHGPMRTYLNLMIVMGLGGLWHGAALGYLAWGLLHGALTGDHQLFAREDGIEETWRIVQPLLDDPGEIHQYEPGSWGPDAARELLRGHRGWQQPWLAGNH